MTVVGVRGGTFTPWFDYTDLSFDTGETRRVWLNPDVVEGKLGVYPSVRFQAGQPVVRYVSDTGSQVLVDKLSYNFRLPKRGEVFVFRTNGIAGIEGQHAAARRHHVRVLHQAVRRRPGRRPARRSAQAGDQREDRRAPLPTSP